MQRAGAFLFFCLIVAIIFSAGYTIATTTGKIDFANAAVPTVTYTVAPTPTPTPSDLSTLMPYPSSPAPETTTAGSSVVAVAAINTPEPPLVAPLSFSGTAGGKTMQFTTQAPGNLIFLIKYTGPPLAGCTGKLPSAILSGSNIYPRTLVDQELSPAAITEGIPAGQYSITLTGCYNWNVGISNG